jgi:hypothetical protein
VVRTSPAIQLQDLRGGTPEANVEHVGHNRRPLMYVPHRETRGSGSDERLQTIPNVSFTMIQDDQLRGSPIAWLPANEPSEKPCCRIKPRGTYR